MALERHKPIFQRKPIPAQRSNSQTKPEPEDAWLLSKMTAGEPVLFVFASGRTVEGRVVAVKKYSVLMRRFDGSNMLLWKQSLESAQGVA